MNVVAKRRPGPREFQELLKALKLGRAIIADELEVLERRYLPEPSQKEAEELTELRVALETIDAAITKGKKCA